VTRGLRAISASGGDGRTASPPPQFGHAPAPALGARPCLNRRTERPMQGSAVTPKQRAAPTRYWRAIPIALRMDTRAPSASSPLRPINQKSAYANVWASVRPPKVSQPGDKTSTRHRLRSSTYHVPLIQVARHSVIARQSASSRSCSGRVGLATVRAAAAGTADRFPAAVPGDCGPIPPPGDGRDLSVRIGCGPGPAGGRRPHDHGGGGARWTDDSAHDGSGRACRQARTAPTRPRS
jgi:hypothetical protein